MSAVNWYMPSTSSSTTSCQSISCMMGSMCVAHEDETELRESTECIDRCGGTSCTGRTEMSLRVLNRIDAMTSGADLYAGYLDSFEFKHSESKSRMLPVRVRQPS
ncbi:hypothetical protein Ae201684P_001743 [Aphanomyces euteiches]|nr:hypothetical protein Ae201684P_001743 [Aphanomyces euteiches]